MLGRGSWVEEGMVRSGRSLLDLRLPGQAAGMPVSQVRKDAVGIHICYAILCYEYYVMCHCITGDYMILRYIIQWKAYFLVPCFFWRPVFLMPLFLTPFCLSAGKK